MCFSSFKCVFNWHFLFTITSLSTSSISPELGRSGSICYSGSSAYRADRPATQTGQSLCLSFLGQTAEKLTILILNFPSLGQNSKGFLKNRGKLFLKKVLGEFLEFFGFTLCFGLLQAKKFFFKTFHLTNFYISLYFNFNNKTDQKVVNQFTLFISDS